MLAKYGYDSLGRRITEGSGVNTRHLFYSSQWQVLEERIYGQTQFQYVWSPVYVDALVLRDRFLVAIPIDHLDAWTIQALTAQSPDVTPILRKERLYVQQDANWNVTALINTAGNVVERFAYDPYGAVKFFTPTWTEKANSNFGWKHLHQGLRRDMAVGLDDSRARVYRPTIMRWVQQDPIDTGDYNLYRAYGNNPGNAVDPDGLDWMRNVAEPGLVIGDIVALNFVSLFKAAGIPAHHDPRSASFQYLRDNNDVREAVATRLEGAGQLIGGTAEMGLGFKAAPVTLGGSTFFIYHGFDNASTGLHKLIFGNTFGRPAHTLTRGAATVIAGPEAGAKTEFYLNVFAAVASFPTALRAQSIPRWQGTTTASRSGSAPVTTVPTGPAHNAANYARLREFYRQAEKYGANGTRLLENGRYRFYGEFRPASTPGQMAGARLVREWDPATGATRTWVETLDQAGTVRSVAPKPPIYEHNHFIFDANGNYVGRR